MARPAKYESDEERRAAAAERRRLARTGDVDPELPVVQLDEAESVLPIGMRSIEELKELSADALLSDVEEQLFRDYLGFTLSDKRTRAERFAVAARIVSRLPASSWRDTATMSKKELVAAGLWLEKGDYLDPARPRL